MRTGKKRSSWKMSQAADTEILRTAIESCKLSVSGPMPIMFEANMVRTMHQWCRKMTEALLGDILRGMDEKTLHDVSVAMTTSFHEGFRLGVEYNRLGGQPPEEIH